MQNAIVDYIVKDSESNLKAIRESIISNQQNIEKAKQKGLPQNVITNLEKHLEELKNEERQSIARQKGTKQVQKSRNVNVGENSEWNISDSYTERVRAIQDGFISEQLSGKIRGSSDKYSRGSIGRQLQEELSVDSRESTNNKERISKQDADRRGIKYSLSNFDLDNMFDEYISSLSKVEFEELFKVDFEKTKTLTKAEL